MNNRNLTKILLATLYKVSSLSIIIGVMISIIFVSNDSNNILGQILPTIVLSCFSAITSCVYMIILTKEYSIIKLHMTKNWIFYDWIAIYINLVNIIFSLSFITAFSIYGMWSTNFSLTLILISIVLVISLIGVGFHQYFFFKVNVDRERRKNGENLKEKNLQEELIANKEETKDAK